MATQQASVSVYENSIPAFTEPALEALYAHVYSSLTLFRIYNSVDGGTHTYVSCDGGKTTAVLLFRCIDRQATVLNEQISISPFEVDRFVRHVFARFPDVDTVKFPALRGGLNGLSYPCQCFYRTEDIVLELPPTTDEYMAKLGKATRKNMKYHGNRLKRNYPALEFRIYVDGEIVPQHVRDIIELNRARMATKNKTSEIDDAETERHVRLVQESGLVSVMLLDGRVVAGTVCSRVGGNYFMHINAHDPAYDDARLGKLCCFMTICECIERDGKAFHFMWGRFEYKYLLLGVQRDFYEATIYRSPARMLLHAGSALRIAYHGYSREWKFRLLDLADRPEEASPALRLLGRSINTLRNVRRSGFAFAQRH